MDELEAVRGHRRGAAWTPVTYGVHRPKLVPSTAQHPPVWAEDDLSGWQLLMTDVGCFTGLTALEVHGVPLPPLPEGSPVFIALAKNDPRPMRGGVHTSRHIRPVEHVVVRGLRVATLPEAFVAAARWVGLVDLVALIDAAIYLELVSLAQLEAFATTRTTGEPTASSGPALGGWPRPIVVGVPAPTAARRVRHRGGAKVAACRCRRSPRGRGGPVGCRDECTSRVRR